MTSRPTGFLGLSHLGIISSIGWASLGSQVVAVDLDGDSVATLSRGELPIYEPALHDLFAKTRHRMSFSSDPGALANCRLVIVSRDVPTDSDNHSDASPIFRLVEAVIPHLQCDATLVVLSQVSPGSTRELAEWVRSRRPELDLQIYYWVETLIFGDAVQRFLKPERIIVGCAEPTAPLSFALEEGLRRFNCPILPMAYESAELTKTAINLYLCAAVTYANTLSDLCEALGADWTEMMPALRLDRRIGPAAYIKPGLGIAGGNLERDMVTLQNLCGTNGVDGSFIETLLDHNARRFQWVRRQLEVHLLREVGDPVIAVWGLSYKKNTRSTKNSTALRAVRELRDRAAVRVYDPVVRTGDIDLSLEVAASRDEILTGADCLLVVTDWDEFAVPGAQSLGSMRRPLIIDAVGIVDDKRADLEGVRLVQMGRPSRA